MKMKRFMMGWLSTAAVLFALGVAGCGGSGVEQGIPANPKAPPPPEGVKLRMENRKPAPPGQVAQPGTPTGTPAPK
jgi:hypothetical protein